MSSIIYGIHLSTSKGAEGWSYTYNEKGDIVKGMNYSSALDCILDQVNALFESGKPNERWNLFYGLVDLLQLYEKGLAP